MPRARLLSSIRRQLFAMFAAPFLAALAIGAGTLWSTWNQRAGAERAANLEMARAIGAAFRAFVDGVGAQETTLGTAILELPGGGDASELLARAAARRGSELSFAWLAPDGTVLASSDRGAIGTSVAGRPEVIAVSRGAERALGNLVLEPGGTRDMTFGIAQAIPNDRGGLGGIVLATVDPERLDDRVLGLNRVGNAGFAIVDAAGRLVMRTPRVERSWAERDVSRVDLVGRALAGEEAVGPTTSMADGRPWVGAAVPIRRFGWVARAGRSRDEIEAPIRADAVRAAGWAAVAAVLAAMASAVIGHRIAGAVSRLERHADALGRGELSRRRVGGPEELERLGRAFDDMAGRLLAATDAARRAARRRDETLAIVSHDLRTPLATIANGAAALETTAAAGTASPASVAATARRIRSASERMRRMAEDLLDLASLDEGKLAMRVAATSPESLVREAAEHARDVAAEKDVDVSWRGDADLPDVLCDPGRIQQVLGNLLSNAIKGSGAGAAVEVRASRMAPGEVRFEVEDWGRGIAADELPGIFDRFRRGRSAEYRGAGLGLAIARGIVEAHGGTIWAESRVGEGTRVLFTLPAAGQPARAVGIPEDGRADGIVEPA